MAAALGLVQQINRISVRYLQPRLLQFRCFHNNFSRHSRVIANERLKHSARVVQLQNGTGKAADQCVVFRLIPRVRGTGFSFGHRLAKR